MPRYDVTGQVAFVTGASAGMEAATARCVRRLRVSAVALADINDAAVTRFASELSDQGHRVLALPCDVADEQQVAEAVSKTVGAFGRLDMPFNNAGIMVPY